MNEFLTPDFSTAIYWSEGTPSFSPSCDSIPASVDVLIIGGGYAGLSTALSLAQAGCSVIICEARQIGFGASSSSAGSLGNVPKAKLDYLANLYGYDVARRIYSEARVAREYVEELIGSLDIRCDLDHGARFVAAHSLRAFRKFRNSLTEIRELFGDVSLIERSNLKEELGSTAFYGGLKIANSATLQPARFHLGLAKAAVEAGAYLLQNQRVTGLRRFESGFEISTPTLKLKAKTIVMATNAETGTELVLGRRLRKRMTVVPAYALVTEEISPDTMDQVLPKRGSFSDTYKLLHYMAPVGSTNRLVMSGRAGRSDGDLPTKASRIIAYFRGKFPALESVRATHCWKGNFAVPADWIPHTGEEDGIHYILGCCGTGVPMSTYLGHKTALRILGLPGKYTVFDRVMPRIPYWPLNNWLLPLAAHTYTLRDKLLR